MLPEWLKSLDDGTATTGIISALISVLGITNKRARAAITLLYKLAQARWKRSREIYQRLEDVLENQKGINISIDDIKYELKPNGGGSIKDSITRMELAIVNLQAYDSYKFRQLNYPAFECDSLGRNLRVSDAYLDLLGLKVNTDLDSLDWSRFIHNDDIENYYKAFQRAVSTNSDFGHSARFYNNALDTLGLWYIRAVRLESGLYIGAFIPQDECSKKIYKTASWLPN